MKENLIKLLSQEKILPILRSSDAKTVIDWANALIDGGVKILEVNVQNPSIYKAIEEISKHASVCAGGIITAMQAEASIASGAKILSSPIFSNSLLSSILKLLISSHSIGKGFFNTFLSSNAFKHFSHGTILIWLMKFFFSIIFIFLKYGKTYSWLYLNKLYLNNKYLKNIAYNFSTPFLYIK